MESEEHKALSEQLLFLIKLAQQPHLSEGARAMLHLQITQLQEQVLKLAPR